MLEHPEISFLVWQYGTKHFFLLPWSFIPARRLGRASQPCWQIRDRRRTTSQKISTVHGLYLWETDTENGQPNHCKIDLLDSQQQKVVGFFQRNLMKVNELAFTGTPSDVTSRWRGTVMVSESETPRTNGIRTRCLCSKGTMTKMLSILSSQSHCAGARSNVFLVIPSAEEVIKFHCGVSHWPNVYGQDWKFYLHVSHSWLNFWIVMPHLHLCLCSHVGISVINDFQQDEIF